MILNFYVLYYVRLSCHHSPKMHHAAQAMDLSGYIEKIDKTCDSPDNRLNGLLPETEQRGLKTCLQQTKQIRNLVAHRVPTHDRAMRKKEAAVQCAISILESMIKKEAEKYQINQV